MLEGRPLIAEYDWHAFFRGNIIQKWWKRRIAKAVWEFMPEGSTVLDIGCGSSPIITRYPGAVGIDSDRDKIEFMKGRCPEQTFIQMSAYNLDFPNGHFDKVICIELLEHLDAEPVMKEISRVVKSSGLVVIATPDFGTWRWKMIEILYGLIMRSGYHGDHVNPMTWESLKKMSLRNNLDLIAWKHVGGADMVCLFKRL